MSVKGKTNAKATIALVVSLCVLGFIIGLLLIINFAAAPPKIEFSQNEKNSIGKAYTHESPENIGMACEMSNSMAGFNIVSPDSLITTTIAQMAAVSDLLGGNLTITKYINGYDANIPLSAQINSVPSAGMNQTVEMITESDPSQDLHITVTDLVDTSGSYGDIVKAINNTVLKEKGNALAIISVMSDFRGELSTQTGVQYSEAQRPFFILLSGKNTKVSYFLGEFLATAKIQKLKENKELFCEIISGDCGISGIDRENIVIDNGNDQYKVKAEEFEKKSKAKKDSDLDASDVTELNNIIANVNFRKSDVVKRPVNSDILNLGYIAKTNRAVPGKLKLNIPFTMLKGVNISSMLPVFESKVYYCNSRKQFVPYEKKIDTGKLKIDLAYTETNFYDYALKMREKQMSAADIEKAIQNKLGSLRDDKQITQQLEREAEDAIKLLVSPDELQVKANQKYTPESYFKTGVVCDPITNAITVNTIYGDLSKLPLDANTKLIKVENILKLGYDPRKIPQWVIEQSTASKQDIAKGKVAELSDIFEGLYHYLQKSSQTEYTFSTYIKLK